MAYDVTEERLKVKGSEQITRDLKVNRDAFINGKVEAGSIDNKGDLKVEGELLAGKDVAISGDLYVNGTEYINNTETAQTTDNYLVLRHNQTTPLGTNEYSGVAVHNYASGKTATITTDKDGTWRVADNTETDTNYTNISYYDGTYYTGLTRTAATVISGMKTAFDEDELDESVYYNNSYYHFDGTNWFPVSLVDNKLTLGSAVTDSTTITALNALTKEDLVYFRTLTITVINPVENQPVLTRAEASDLTGGQALTWDATNQKAVGKTIDTTVTANSSNLVTSGAVASSINALDVASVGGDGKYISAISETDGKISATATTMDTAPTAGSTKAVTSGGVATAIGNCNSKITIAADTTTAYSDGTAIHVNAEETNPTSIKTRTALNLWNYIKGKISSVLGLTATSYGGNAASASQADTVDGYHANIAATPSTVAVRNASGYLNANIFHDSWSAENINSFSAPTVMFKGNGDGYIRNTSLADLKTAMGISVTTVHIYTTSAGSGIGGQDWIDVPYSDLEDGFYFFVCEVSRKYNTDDFRFSAVWQGSFRSNYGKYSTTRSFYDNEGKPTGVAGPISDFQVSPVAIGSLQYNGMQFRWIGGSYDTMTLTMKCIKF